MIVLVLALVAGLVALIALFRSQGQSLEAWGVLALAVALALANGIHL